MRWFNLLAAQLPLLVLNAQGVRRLEIAYPALGRRLVANCTNNCGVCAAAYKIEWSLREPPNSIQTLTVMEVVNTDDGSTSVTTLTDGLSSSDLDVLSSSRSLASSGPHTSAVDVLSITMTYPTPYVVFQDNYQWTGTLLTDNACTTPTNGAEVKAPAPTPLPTPAFSTVAPGITDTAGWYFDLNVVSFDDQLAQFFDDGALKSCTPSNLPGCALFASTADLTTNPPQLSGAFATVCQRTTKGVNGVEKLADCSSVTAPPLPASTAGNGGGGGAASTERHTTTDSQGSTVIVAGNGGGSAGGEGGDASTARRTTTDAKGSTIVVVGGSASSGGNGGGGQTITDEHTSDIMANGGSGGNLQTSINPQGQTIIVTAASTTGGSDRVAGGQITLVNQDGSTIVIQGGTLASPGSGGGVTVTDNRGSTMVVQGGETGTLSVASDGGTVLIDGTITQTSWVPGETISLGDSASASAAPTLQSEADSKQVPFPLTISGPLFLATVIVFVML